MHAVRRLPPWFVPLLVAYVGVRIVVFAAASMDAYLAQRGVFGPRVSEFGPFDFLTRWDGRFYRTIASDGYPTTLAPGVTSELAFMSTYPLTIRALMTFGMGSVSAALLVANTAALTGMIALASVTARVFNAEIARRSVVYLAMSPFGFVFAMGYSEGIALATGFGAVALLQRNRLAAATLLAVAAGATRPTGVVIALALAAVLVAAADRRPRAWVVVAAPALGLALHLAYIAIHTGNAMVFFEAQRAWRPDGANPLGPVDAYIDALRTLRPKVPFWTVRDGMALLVMTVLLIGAWKRVPRLWLAYGAATILMPTATGTIASSGRYALMCLPAFWMLAFAGRDRVFDALYRLIAPGLLAIGVITLVVHSP